MSDIKIGDKIKCVYANQNHTVFTDKLLTTGKIYEVIDRTISRYSEPLLHIILDNGRTDKVLIVYNNEVWFEKVEEKIDFLELLKGY